MKLTSDNETLAQNKVLILYILNTVNKPVNNAELLQLVLSITDMNYFYFQQFLLDRMENKYILKTTNKDFTSKIYKLLYNDANFYFKRKFQKMNIVKQYRDKSYSNIYDHRNA